MNDLSPETRKLIDMAREGDPLPPGRRAMLESKLFTRVAGGVLIGLAAREAWAMSGGLFSSLAKGVAGLAIVSSIGAGGYLAVRAVQSRSAVTPATWVAPQAAIATHDTKPAHETIAQAPQVAVVAPSRVSDTSETPRRSRPTEAREERRGPVGPAPVARSSRSQTATASGPANATTAAAPAPEATPAPPAPAPTAEEAQPARVANNSLADETRLILEADQALRSGNTSRAVTLLDEHASRYPEGALGPERGGERVIALCKLDRIDASTVRSYLSSHPNLSLSDRVRQACARVLSRSK